MRERDAPGPPFLSPSCLGLPRPAYARSARVRPSVRRPCPIPIEALSDAQTDGPTERGGGRTRTEGAPEFSANVAYLRFAIVATLKLNAVSPSAASYVSTSPNLTFSLPLPRKKIHCNLRPEPEDRKREEDKEGRTTVGEPSSVKKQPDSISSDAC